MVNKILINETELQVKEYNGQRIVSFSDVDIVHNRPSGTAHRNFKANKCYLHENEDYYVLKPRDILKDEFRPLGFENEKPANRGTIYLTESGYLLLVKSFTDDLAWHVQRQLVNSYFKLKELTTSVQETTNAVMLTPQDLQSAVEVIHDCASVFQSMIDYATINYQQQNELLQAAKDRVNYLLGGAHSVKYKKHSRTYFKNLWIQFCQAFHCDSYKNLNPLYMADNVARNWIASWVYEK